MLIAMSEAINENGSYLVRVRAQVMTRDDSTGGWVPMGGGGLSMVSVRKRVLTGEDEPKHEYVIYGKRLTDQAVVLSCTIKKDFQYNKVMPTFHHWKTGDKKFGLTFATASDARAFNKGVRMAVEDLLDAPALMQFQEADLGDDDVFMTVELPAVDSHSSSGSSNMSANLGSKPVTIEPGGPLKTSSTSPGELYTSPYIQYPKDHHSKINIIRSSRTVLNGSGGMIADIPQKLYPEEVWTKDKDKGDDGEPYVQFAKEKVSIPSRTEPPHDYAYPMVESLKQPIDPTSGSSQPPIEMVNLKKASLQPPLLPTKGKKKTSRRSKKKDQPSTTSPASAAGRVQCHHCLETFTEAENPRGGCEFAPDPVVACIERVTCVNCAQALVYHCASDPEAADLALCEGGGWLRWASLGMLSLVLPCLWCYFPLKACHSCGIKCGICGSRHEPA